MNKQLFLEGRVFEYTGNFRRIGHHKFIEKNKQQVEVLKRWHYHAKTECMVTATIDEAWYVQDVMDDKFYVWQQAFGRIPILFKECKLVEEGAAA